MLRIKMKRVATNPNLDETSKAVWFFCVLRFKHNIEIHKTSMHYAVAPTVLEKSLKQLEKERLIKFTSPDTFIVL